MKAQVTKEYVTLRMRVDEWDRLKSGVLVPERTRMQNLDSNVANLLTKILGAVDKPCNGNWIEVRDGN